MKKSILLFLIFIITLTGCFNQTDYTNINFYQNYLTSSFDDSYQQLQTDLDSVRENITNPETLTQQIQSLNGTINAYFNQVNEQAINYLSTLSDEEAETEYAKFTVKVDEAKINITSKYQRKKHNLQNLNYTEGSLETELTNDFEALQLAVESR